MSRRRKQLLIGSLIFVAVTFLYFLIIYLIFNKDLSHYKDLLKAGENESYRHSFNVLLNNRFSLHGAYLLVIPSLFLFILYKILFNRLDYISFTCSAVGIITSCIFAIARYKFINYFGIYAVVIFIISIGLAIISFLNFRYYLRVFRDDKFFDEQEETVDDTNASLE